ncbi:MAG TPA: multiheme c-type cytochrome [Pyrinomonadaceae bacterium]|jgi:hypothetical protein
MINTKLPYALILGASLLTAVLFGQDGVIEKWYPRRVPLNVEFVGDQACAECHQKMVASHALGGMGRAAESVAESKVLTANPTLVFRAGTYSFEIQRRGRESFYTVTDGKEKISLPILYAFGQGKAGQTYVLQYDGAFYEGKVSFFRELGGLDFTIGQARTVPDSLKQAVGRRLSEEEAFNCFSCHSTGGARERQIRLDKLTPGVRCEACHGPGAQHVRAIKEGEPGARLIFNPGRLSPDELTQKFCASCHQAIDDFSLPRTAEIKNVRFQPYRIFQSKCYSDDRRISCTACHDPHQPVKHDDTAYDAKCLACHAAKGQAAAQGLAVGCRVGTRDCVSCHMPKVAVADAHFKFTDHYIRVVKTAEKFPN